MRTLLLIFALVSNLAFAKHNCRPLLEAIHEDYSRHRYAYEWQQVGSTTKEVANRLDYTVFANDIIRGRNLKDRINRDELSTFAYTLWQSRSPFSPNYEYTTKGFAKLKGKEFDTIIDFTGVKYQGYEVVRLLGRGHNIASLLDTGHFVAARKDPDFTIAQIVQPSVPKTLKRLKATTERLNRRLLFSADMQIKYIEGKIEENEQRIAEQRATNQTSIAPDGLLLYNGTSLVADLAEKNDQLRDFDLRQAQEKKIALEGMRETLERLYERFAEEMEN